jgi:hypothetical protein
VAMAVIRPCHGRVGSGEQDKHQQRYAFHRALISSAPTGTIHWAAAVSRRPREHADARRADAYRGSSDRPWAQHNTGPYDAASRIINVLAVNHGIGRLRTHGNSDECCQRNTGARPPDEARHDDFLRLPPCGS